MTAILRRSAAALALAALVSFASLLNTSPAQAQVCAGLRVTNNTPCNIILCLYDAGGVIVCNPVPAGAVAVPFPAPPGFAPIGAVSNGGFNHPFAPPPPLPGCTPCITLRSTTAPLCCGTVCYNPTTCRITVTAPCTTPCVP